MADKTNQAAGRAESTGLPDIPGQWSERQIDICGQSFTLAVPDQPDLLLDDPQVLNAQEQDDFMPYWAYLWPVARQMAGWVLESATWPSGTRVLEIGSGLGLVGMAALSRGDLVTLSDYAPEAVQIARYNALRNQLQPAACIALDWRQPLPYQYPAILGCDVIYEARNGPPILHLLDTMLAAGGVCWLGDQVRTHSQSFITLAIDHGYNVQQFDAAGEPIEKLTPGGFQRLVLTRQS